MGRLGQLVSICHFSGVITQIGHESACQDFSELAFRRGSDIFSTPGRRFTEPGLRQRASHPACKASRHSDAENADSKGMERRARRRPRHRGLNVNAFATGLKHPRWIHVLPNGDVLAAEALSVAGPIKTAFDYAIFATMRRAAAVGVSLNRIALSSLGRRRRGDETSEVFLDGLNQPFGMALLGDTFYVGNTDAVVAFPYTSGDTHIRTAGRKLTDLKSWRALDAEPACEPRRAQALHRCRFSDQYWRQRLSGRRRTRRHPRA